MNCTNCGGAMELSPARGYFFCRYCGSFHFPDTVAGDGIRILGDNEPPLPCAACSKPLAPAMLDDAHAVQYCRNCRGVLMPRRSFASVIQRRRAWATDPPPPPGALDRKELDRKVACPSCGKPMATHPYYGPGNVVIDTCEGCEVIWLDFGEMKQIVDAPGKDRGTREQPPLAPEPSAGLSITGARVIGTGLGADTETEVDFLSILTRLF
jgi:Zn-finger nucleic acid-binding protein